MQKSYRLNWGKYIYWIMAITSITSIFAQQPAVDFIPEVKNALTVQSLDVNRLEKNLFIYFNGIKFPRNNYGEIYKTVFLKNYANIQQSLVENTFDTVKIEKLEDYLQEGEHLLSFSMLNEFGKPVTSYLDFFPCGAYLNQQCLQDTIKQQVTIKTFIENNNVLFERYAKSLEQVTHYDFIAYPDNTFLHDNFAWPHYRDLHKLRLSEAILQINAGHLDTGLEILTHERALIELMLSADSKASLLDIIFTLDYIQDLDQVLNALLDEGKLDTVLDDTRVEALFSPYTAIQQQAIARAYQREIFNVFSPVYNAQLTYSDTVATPLVLDAADEFLALIWLNSVIQSQTTSYTRLAPHLLAQLEQLRSSYQLHQWVLPTTISDFLQEHDILEAIFINENYLQDEVNKVTLKAIINWLSAYFSSKNISFEALRQHFNNEDMVQFYNELYTALKNYSDLIEQDPLGTSSKQLAIEIDKNYPPATFTTNHAYLTKMSEQNNYHHLVYLKYRIVRDKIPESGIPAFLASMRELAINPITQAPYLWNASEKTLSSPLGDKFNIPANIRKNNEATHYKVWIKL